MNFIDILGSIPGLFSIFFEYWFGCETCLEGFINQEKIAPLALFYAVWGLLLFALVHHLCAFLLEQIPALEDDEDARDVLISEDVEDDDFIDDDDSDTFDTDTGYSQKSENSFRTPFVLPISLFGGGFVLFISVVLLEIAFWTFGSRDTYPMNDFYSTANAMLLFSALTAPITVAHEILKFIKAAVEKVTSAQLSPADTFVMSAASLGSLCLYAVAYFDVLHVVIGAPYSTILWATLLPILVALLLFAPIALLFFRKIRKLRSLLRV